MVPTSLPTLLAYAPCSLLSLVLFLILKNTSSPVELTTWRMRATVSSDLKLRMELVCLDVDCGILLRLDFFLAWSGGLFLVGHGTLLLGAGGTSKRAILAAPAKPPEIFVTQDYVSRPWVLRPTRKFSTKIEIKLKKL